MRVRILAVFVTFAIGCGAHHGSRVDDARARKSPPSVPKDPIVEDPSAPVGGDGKLHLHRNAFALEQVEQAAHHFTVWYSHIEPCHCEVSVIGDRAYLTGCMWGGFSVPPDKVPAVPASVESLVEVVEEALHDYEPEASNIKLAYHGHYRTIVVSEMIPITRGAPFDGKLSGWHGRVVLRADPALTRIEGAGNGMSMSGFGLVDVPEGAARVPFDLPPEEDGRVLLAARLMKQDGVARASGSSKALLDASLDVARKVARGERVPTMRALLKAPLDTSLPPGYDPTVRLRVTLFARPRAGREQKSLELGLHLHPRAVVKDGVSIAAAEGDVGDLHVRATAKLGAFTPSATSSAQSKPFREGAGKDVEAPLTVRIEDGRGNVLERTYPARGKLLVDNEGAGEALAAALPVGLELPGTSSPSKEAEALHVAWPGTPSATSVDVYVDPVLFASPRGE